MQSAMLHTTTCIQSNMSRAYKGQGSVSRASMRWLRDPLLPDEAIGGLLQFEGECVTVGGVVT